MKTEYRPISMRCTEKQFNSIKDRIPLPVSKLLDFNHCPYLTNDFGGHIQVGLIKKEWRPSDFEIHETFDGELFLDCCGRESDNSLEYQDLFNYMSEEHDVILMGSEIKEIERLILKDKVWKGSELDVRRVGEITWKEPYCGNEYRLKPLQPDYIAEIEALKQKAKENGMKCIINFEKL